MPSSTIDLKNRMSAATSDVEKQTVNEIPVLSVVARKSLGAGVSDDDQKIHDLAKVQRRHSLSESSQRP